MRRVDAGVCAATLMVLIAACGGGGQVRVAQGAVSDVRAIVGSRGLTTLELTADDVSRLATEANVAEDVIRDTAPQLDNQGLWSRSMFNLEGMYEKTPGEIRSNLVGLACDGARGKVTTQAQLEQNVSERFAGYSPNQLAQFSNDVLDLWQELYEAGTSSDPELQAAAVLTCFTVEQYVG